MRIGQIKAQNELARHGHKRSLILKTTKKQRNTKETIKELLDHYRHYHNLSTR